MKFIAYLPGCLLVLSSFGIVQSQNDTIQLEPFVTCGEYIPQVFRAKGRLVSVITAEELKYLPVTTLYGSKEAELIPDILTEWNARTFRFFFRT